MTSDPGSEDRRKLCDLACAVAQEAAELLLPSAGQASVVQTKSSPTDVVTEMDRAAEELIRDRLQHARPGDAILGEEGGETGAGAAVRWIVDPLDGTVNYLYGLPDWAVSIAAEVDGVVTAGAVCAPVRQSLYFATLGGGSWLRSAWLPGIQRLACNTGVELAGALVATGFSYSARQRARQGQLVAALLPQVRDIRRAGSAALDLCSVASGRVDGYYERGVNYWDIAAGSLIAREARAVVGGLDGAEPSPAMTIAACPTLFTQLQDLLFQLDPENQPGAG